MEELFVAKPVMVYFVERKSRARFVGNQFYQNLIKKHAVEIAPTNIERVLNIKLADPKTK